MRTGLDGHSWAAPPAIGLAIETAAMMQDANALVLIGTSSSLFNDDAKLPRASR
jgi:hypothetical protein